MADVVLHPHTAAMKALLGEADSKSGAHLAKMLVEAIVKGLPRSPFVSFFGKEREHLTIDVDSFLDFMDWTRRNMFRVETTIDPAAKVEITPTQGPADEAPAISDPARDQLLNAVFEAGVADAEKSQRLESYFAEIASDHRYGWFIPGWQFDGADWSAWFKDNDPCVTISFFLDALFAGPAPTRARGATYTLTDADRELVDILLDLGASRLMEEGYFEGRDREEVRALLNALCEAWRWGEGISSFSPDYFAFASEAPKLLRQAMIAKWAEDGPEWAYHHKLIDDDTLSEQHRFVVAYLVKTLQRLGAPPNCVHKVEDIYDAQEFDDYPSDDTCDADLLLSVKDAFWTTALEINDIQYDKVLSEAIYNARDSVMGGVFPFSRNDSYSYIGALQADVRFWLTIFSGYSAKGVTFYVDQYFGDKFSLLEGDPYLAFPWETSAPDKQPIVADSSRAEKRWRAFRLAVQGMSEGRLDELARAWWAFFLASQARAFANLGLSPTQIGDVADQTRKLLPDDQIERSIAYALACLNDKLPLTSRVLRRELASLSPHEHREMPTDANAFGKRTEEFIIQRVGEQTWRALHPGSRTELVAAERLWDWAAREFGLRHDWGGIVLHYAGVIESEMKLHWAGALDELERHGLMKKNGERTLGAMKHALRAAQQAIRKDQAGGLTQLVREKITQSKPLIDNLPFWTDVRNNAAHGNRDKPADESVLHRCRSLILNDHYLDGVIGLCDSLR
jgi:hypothetical protein